MKTIAVYSAKGGVGKSTIAVHLAHMAATRSGRRTLLWDLDAQGASTFALKLRPKPGLSARGIFARQAEIEGQALASEIANLDVVPADDSLRRLDAQLAEQDKKNRLRKLIADLDGSYDRVVLDCPPGLGLLADQLFRAADLLVVPLLPSPLSLRAYEAVMAHVAGQHGGKLPVLPVFSMADRRKALHRDTLAAHPDWPVVPYSSEIERMALHRQPVTQRAPSSPAARSLSELWTRIERALG
jgi:chromosome partitioning protein